MISNRLVLGLVAACYLAMGLLLVTGGQASSSTSTPTNTPRITNAPDKVSKKPKAKPRTTRVEKHHASRSRANYRYPVQLNTPSKRYAHGLVQGSQWPCLHELWMRESGWSPTSDNPTSSAYGIPQILGLPKHLTAAQQVDRGLAYISHRYGTPCKAWAFWTTHRWY